jgi:hypothetical protein
MHDKGSIARQIYVLLRHDYFAVEVSIEINHLNEVSIGIIAEGP